MNTTDFIGSLSESDLARLICLAGVECAENQDVWSAMEEKAEKEEWTPAQIALALHLDCDPSEIFGESYDNYGLTVFSFSSQEYAVGTSDEADSACSDYIKDSIWAFKASFIVSECGLPDALTDAIQSWQEKECEGANEGLLELVEKMCGLDSFVESAVSADGRGHLLASYDGDELELAGGFVAFRIN